MLNQNFFPGESLASIDYIMQLTDDHLYTAANNLRQQYFGKKINLCSIINIRSGGCAMDCHFCSQSRYYYSDIRQFPLIPREELSNRILALSKNKHRRIGLVASGSALSPDELELLCKILDELPQGLKFRLCASLGKLSKDALKMLWDVGIRRYHHNLECSKSFYPRICSTQSWDERRDTVIRAQECGFSVCCGGLFGMGESWQQRFEFVTSLQKLGIDQIPLNFLHPQPGTPLAKMKILSAQEALRIIASFRIFLPKSTLRICGGRPMVFSGFEKRIFYSGANALMIGDYLTTSGCNESDDLAEIHRLGLEIATCGL